MGIRFAFAIALGAALLVTALGSPAPGSIPPPQGSPTAAPLPSLAPVGIDAASNPDASAEPNLPKVLGHIYTSAYCTDFVEHFNVAATTITSDDEHLTSVDTTLRRIEDDYDRTDGASRIYRDRVALIAQVSQMMKDIPVSQAAIDALLAQAKATTDPARKAALQESASQLQRTLDRQHAVAIDLGSVIRVLMDKHTSEDTAEYNIQMLMPPGIQSHANLLDDPVPEPGSDTTMRWTASPSPSPGATAVPGSVEDILQWSRQRGIIQTAESQAKSAADRVVRICDGENVPTASPKPAPSTTPLPAASTSP